jgi:hypothetical protein
LDLFYAGNSLSRNDTYFIGRVRHKKIIGVIEPSLTVGCIYHRRHAIMNPSDQIVCVNGNDAERPPPISGRVAPVSRIPAAPNGWRSFMKNLYSRSFFFS